MISCEKHNFIHPLATSCDYCDMELTTPEQPREHQYETKIVSGDELNRRLRALCLELADACEAVASGSVYHDNGSGKTPKTRCRWALYGNREFIERLRGEG